MAGVRDRVKSRNGNRGAALILAMIFLVLLALIAGTVMQTSIQEFQMAGNAQFREEAFQRAQAIAEEISEDLDNFPVTGDVGYKICATGCNGTNFIQALTTATVPTGVNVDYQVERQGPRFIESLPFRQSQAEVSSSPAFDAALFEVSVSIDGSAARLGSAEVVQGVAIRVASSSQ
jgi:Tfp pilus assembly protein PilX